MNQIKNDTNPIITSSVITSSVIKNRETLLSHGLVKARKSCLDIIEYALNAVDPYHATHKAVQLHGETLIVDGREYDLKTIDHIYVIGAGKATFRQAQAMDEILGDRIDEGLVVVKHGQASPLNHIKILESAHPVPDHNSFTASQEVIKLAKKAGEKDLVICLMSGGVSSNCCSPVDGISNADKIEMNRLLVHCGAQVTEIMSVRRHLSKIKGGRLGLMIQPATCITLTVSDAIGDPMEWNADWTHPDSSTFQDAVEILHRYGLWDQIPASVRDYFSKFTNEKETPKSLEDGKFQYCMTIKTTDVWKAAAKQSKKLGFTPYLLTSELKGESREAGRVLSSIAMEAGKSHQFFQIPCALIATGETGVRIHGEPKGKGGANQELGCGACLDLTLEDNVVVGAIDTDGTDGPTDYAGALTDGFSMAAAQKKGIDFHKELMEHNTSELLKSIGDIIYTGHTGSNVNDLVVILVL
jgi:glycerate 2-kinase